MTALLLLLSACAIDREVGRDLPLDAGRSDAALDAGPVRCGDGDDPDGDGISSLDEGDDDPDGDGRPSSVDTDADGDGIGDAREAGDGDCETPPVDTDGDGVPDFLDADSDGDTIADAHEGAGDVDADGTPAYLDLDSDGDGVADAVEAGDDDLDTPPVECPREVDPATLRVLPDGLEDYVDPDSDNDGLSDADELALGTRPCAVDTDGDGFGDLAEGAYERVNCPDGRRGSACGCATDASCTIPPQHFYVVLPFRGGSRTRDLRFDTTIRSADVFFLTDTTASMIGTLLNVKNTVGTPDTGLIERVGDAIGDVWFGGGQHEDFPFGPYGDPGDEAFRLAIGLTPQTLPGRDEGSGREAVAAAFAAMTLHAGGDPPESHVEALYQVVTGEGGAFSRGVRRYEIEPASCPARRFGAPCFREGALPVIVHFTDVCAHNGPPGEDEAACSPYTAIEPAARAWDATIAAMRRRGAKYVGVNTSPEDRCAGVREGAGRSPCFFMNRTAEATGAVDVDGSPLVFDVPNGSTDAFFVAQVTGALTTLATRVPVDVDTLVRDDPGDPEGVDARRFVVRREPACSASPPADECWFPPPGLPPEQAVAGVDESTFFGVVPGTDLAFRITFDNDFRVGGSTAQVFTAFIDVRGAGSYVLDTRQVFIVVPALTTF